LNPYPGKAAQGVQLQFLDQYAEKKRDDDDSGESDK
jgi:hypothetical protein